MTYAVAPKQTKLIANSGVMSVQLAVSTAKQVGGTYVSLSTHRVPRTGAVLGRKVQYPVEETFTRNLVVDRFEKGDPTSVEETIVALRVKFQPPTSGHGLQLIVKPPANFQIVLTEDKRLREWLCRVFVRMRYVPTICMYIL